MALAAVVANEALVAFEALPAYEADVANEEVPNNEPVMPLVTFKLPVTSVLIKIETVVLLSLIFESYT